MKQCPLCKQPEFTFEQRAADRTHDVNCKHCHRFIVDDVWLRHFESQPAGDHEIEEFRKIVVAAADIGFIFEIREARFGRPVPRN